MITLEDFKNYFFMVYKNPLKSHEVGTGAVQISIQIEYKDNKGKDSYIKIFNSEEITKINIEQAKALAMSEFLEKLNEDELNG